MKHLISLRKRKKFKCFRVTLVENEFTFVELVDGHEWIPKIISLTYLDLLSANTLTGEQKKFHNEHQKLLEGSYCTSSS